jgi:hypothetical protein
MPIALNKQIQNIIAEEIRKEKERAEAEAKKAAAEKAAKEKASAGSTTTTTGTTAAKEEKAAPVITGLTPEMELIGKNFAGNKAVCPGRLKGEPLPDVMVHIHIRC